MVNTYSCETRHYISLVLVYLYKEKAIIITTQIEIILYFFIMF